MISYKHRFHGYGSLKYVYRNGKTVRGPLFAIKYDLNPKRNEYRLAVVVSKKISKLAVKRNRIRRRLYEVVRSFESEITEPYDLVITVFSDQILDTPSNELMSVVKTQLKQAGVIS